MAANFSGVPLQLRIGVPYEGGYKEILNTDDEEFGGSGNVNARIKRTAKKEWDERPCSIQVKLAPLALSILEYREDDTAARTKTGRKKTTEEKK